jgi:PAS domain S-box-containing protein
MGVHPAFRSPATVPSELLVLNVDDSEAGRYATSRALTQAGFRVVEASTGEQAVAVARAQDPDLIVLDVHLPDMSGLEVCSRLRADPATAGVPVLHLTATYASSDKWAAALDHGADAYLTEPVDPVVLVATVRALLRTRAAEAAVRREAERWHITFDTMPHGVAYLDADGTLRRVNRALAELYGRPAEDLVGTSGLPPLPGLPQPPGGWPLERARRSLTREVAEVRWRDRWLEIAVDPVAPGGEFLGAVRTITDITERKRAEHELQGAITRLDSILSGITDAYFSFDRDWRFLAINRVAAETIFRRPARELLGLSARDVYPEFLRSDFARQYQRAWDTGQPVHFEGPSDVLGRWYEVHGYPQADRLEVYLRDITDRKQAAVEREQLLQRERAARLEAEAANRLKDEFLATLSHELRTPLNAIVGWAAVLRGQTLEPELRRAADTIDRNARAQSQLIEDILDVSRIVTGKLALEVAPVDLVTVVGAALESLRPSCEAKQIHLEVDLDPALPSLMGDRGRLQQVIWNLLSNSVKFTEARGTVALSARADERGVRLEIRDTGAGIAPDFLPHVFERFRQADASTTRAHGGLGLGLAIVRHLVELHGGSVEAESEGVGRGATFRVRLPVRRAVAPAAPAPRGEMASAAAEVAPPVRLDGVRALVVDDDPDTLALLVTILGASGAQALAASSAQDALATFLAKVPDVLVTDIGLPGEDGFSLLAAVRALPTTEGGQVPALALTAYARAEDRERALRSGFDLHVPKPVDPEALLAAIADLVRSPRRRTAS